MPIPICSPSALDTFAFVFVEPTMRLIGLRLLHQKYAAMMAQNRSAAPPPPAPAMIATLVMPLEFPVEEVLAEDENSSDEEELPKEEDEASLEELDMPRGGGTNGDGRG